MSDIFAIDDPENCICSVLHYDRSHSVMQLEVRNEISDKMVILEFIWLQYFEGVVKWKGADFIQEDEQKCLQMLHSILPVYAQYPDEFVLELFRLYTAHGGKVKILSSPPLVSETFAG